MQKELFKRGESTPEVHAAEPSAKTTNSHCQRKLRAIFKASFSWLKLEASPLRDNAWGGSAAVYSFKQ